MQPASALQQLGAERVEPLTHRRWLGGMAAMDGVMLFTLVMGIFFATEGYGLWWLPLCSAVCGNALLGLMALYHPLMPFNLRRHAGPILAMGIAISLLENALYLWLEVGTRVFAYGAGFGSLSVIVLIAWRVALLCIRDRCLPPAVMIKPFVLVGEGEPVQQLHHHLRQYYPSPFLYAGMHHAPESLLHAIRYQGVEEVFWVPTTGSQQADVLASLKQCAITLYRVDNPYHVTDHASLYVQGRVVQRHPLSSGWGIVKDAGDRLVALLLLLVLLPFLVAVGMVIRGTSKGPALFLQSRGGINGTIFTIWKFRTMRNEGDPDTRLTPIGRVLRSSSMDELPQLVNVMKGDMSFVGPRPHTVAHDAYYSSLIPHYPLRFRVKPGLSGWAQVHKSIGSVKSLVGMRRRIRYDNAYIDQWSPFKELEILLKTAWLVMWRIKAAV